MAIRRDKLDSIYSLLVRERADNRCEYTAKTPDEVQLECAHIEGRRNKSTRWHPDNAISLSHASHRMFTENPLLWSAWVRGRLGEPRYLDLLKNAHTPRKFTARELEGLYQHYLKEYTRLRQARENGREGRIEFFWPDESQGFPEAEPRGEKTKAKKKLAAKRKIQSRRFPTSKRKLRRAA